MDAPALDAAAPVDEVFHADGAPAGAAALIIPGVANLPQVRRTTSLPAPVPDRILPSTSGATQRAVRPKSSSSRPPPAPSMTTRRAAQQQRQREEATRDSFRRVRNTIESVQQRPPSVEGSIPDVFASFSSADLIRGNIVDWSMWEQLESNVFAPETEDDADIIETITLSDATFENDNPQPSTSAQADAAASAQAQPSTSAQANQSSILFQPLRNFFGSFVGEGEPGPSAPVPRETSTPKD